MSRPPETSWWKKTDPYPQTAKSPISSYIPLWEWTLENDVRNVSNCFTKLEIVSAKIADQSLFRDIDCKTQSHTKVLPSMENAHIMLNTATKCSNYAKN